MLEYTIDCYRMSHGSVKKIQGEQFPIVFFAYLLILENEKCKIKVLVLHMKKLRNVQETEKYINGLLIKETVG